MLSKSRLKYLKSLHQKKVRDEEGVFIVEGKKITCDVFCSDSEIVSICATEDFIKEHDAHITAKNVVAEVISQHELQSISCLQHPDDCFLVVKKKNPHPDFSYIASTLSVYLDGIRDPGNLGTILRLCDWFGIKNVYCSSDTVDVYNPKVIQSSMGSFLRVMPFYISLSELCEHFPSSALFDVYGTFMEGENVLSIEKFSPGILVVGNESNGIREEINKLITRRITIPSFSTSAESLNAAMACAVILGQYRRLTPC